jgi:hypothetical protein
VLAAKFPFMASLFCGDGRGLLSLAGGQDRRNTVEQVELDNALNTLADQRWANIQTSGKTVPWDVAKAYLATRAGGGTARKPAARKLSR